MHQSYTRAPHVGIGDGDRNLPVARIVCLPGFEPAEHGSLPRAKGPRKHWASRDAVLPVYRGFDGLGDRKMATETGVAAGLPAAGPPRGIDIDQPSCVAQIAVDKALGALPRPLSPTELLDIVVARLAAERSETLPVIDADSHLLGVVAASDVERALNDDQESSIPGSLVRSLCVPLCNNSGSRDFLVVWSSTV